MKITLLKLSSTSDNLWFRRMGAWIYPGTVSLAFYVLSRKRHGVSRDLKVTCTAGHRLGRVVSKLIALPSIPRSSICIDQESHLSSETSPSQSRGSVIRRTQPIWGHGVPIYSHFRRKMCFSKITIFIR